MRKIYFAAWLIVTGCSVVVDGAEIEERVLIDRLRDALEKEENVLLAYLFGSRAAGKASSVSDFDLAVLLKDNSLVGIGCVLFSASKALGVNEDAVDILDLSKAPLRLKVKVLKEGVKLVDRGYEEAVIQDVNKNFPEIALEIRKELCPKKHGPRYHTGGDRHMRAHSQCKATGHRKRL
jgi:predicted nucleotidyltransferase